MPETYLVAGEVAASSRREGLLEVPQPTESVTRTKQQIRGERRWINRSVEAQAYKGSVSYLRIINTTPKTHAVTRFFRPLASPEFLEQAIATEFQSTHEWFK